MSIILEYAITAIVCLISAIVIQRIYQKERRNTARKDEVRGIMWFGLAIFIWGLGALLTLVFVSSFGWSTSDKYAIFLGVCVSLLNSMFILLSLPSIEYTGNRGIIIRLVERFSEREFISIYLSVMVMLSFVFFATSYTTPVSSTSLIWLIDIPVSIVVAFALLNALNKAFSNRNMRFMYLPSFALFVLIVIAVTHRIAPEGSSPSFISEATWGILGTITGISFKMLFILLFSILLYSWKFLSEKEQQQTQLEKVVIEKTELEESHAKLTVANESHIETISRLKEELKILQESSTVALSDRQKEVLGNLGLLGNEKSYTEIAEAMHIGVDGFQTHIHQIKKALHISGSAGKHLLIQYAIDNDMLKYATLSTE